MNYKILSKFIKDISFEIPNVQSFILLEKEIKNYSLNFEIKSNKFKDNIIEVNTILRLVPGDNIKNKLLTEINFTALVSVDSSITNKEELEKIILINVPEEIYPSLYETFIFLFSQSGIKNINIDKKVSFEKLYNEKFKS
jgi:preprotein translocase subunit SecB